MTSLDILGVSESEEKIYRILLVSGQLSVGEIRIATSLDQESIHSGINSLKSKKLIREIPGLQGRYACLLPLGNLKEELEQSVNEVTTLGIELKETSTKVLETMETELKEVSQKFISDLEAQKTKLEEESIELSSQALNDQEELKQNVNQLISDIESTEKKRIEDTQTQMSGSISDHTSKTVGALNSRLNNIDTKVEEIKQNQDSIKAEANSDLAEIDFTPLENIKTDTIGSADSFVSQVNDAVIEAQNKLDNSADKLNVTIKDESDKIQTIGKQYRDETNTTLDNISTAITDLITKETEELNTFNQNITTNKTEAVDKIKTSKDAQNSVHEGLQQAFTAVKTKFQDYHTESSSDMQSATIHLGSKVQQFLDQSDEEINNQTDALKNLLNTSFTEETGKLHSLLEEHINQVLSQSKQQLEEFNVSFGAKINDVVSELNSKRSEGKTAVESVINSSVSELQESFQSSVDKRQGTENTFFTTLNEKITETKQTIDLKLNTIIEELENLSSTINSHTQSVHDQSEKLGQSSSEHVNSLKTNLESNFNTTVAQALTEIGNILDQEILQLKEHHQNISSELSQAFTQINSSIQENIQQKVEQMKEASQQIYDKTITNLKTAVDVAHDKYMELIDANRTTSVGSVKQAERNIETLETDLKAVIESGITELNIQIQSLTETLQTETTQFLDKAYTQIQSHTTNVKDAGNQSIKQITQISSSGGDTQVATVKNTFESYQNKYDETTKIVSEKTLALAGVLDGLFNMQEDTETPPIKTSTVIGKDAISEHLKEIITRIKRGVTILAPSIDMIDQEQILGMKRTSQVTIISNIDVVTHKDWIDKMHGATANVILRTITKTGFGGEMPVFIGVERDGEEILFGTVDEGTNDYVAIASASEYFVKILGSIGISGWSMGNSKQIKK